MCMIKQLFIQPFATKKYLVTYIKLVNVNIFLSSIQIFLFKETH